MNNTYTVYLYIVYIYIVFRED